MSGIWWYTQEMFIMIFNFILYFDSTYLRFFFSFSYPLIPSQLFLTYLASFRGPWFTESSGNPEILSFYEIPGVFHISEFLKPANIHANRKPSSVVLCLLNSLVKRKIKKIFHLFAPIWAFSCFRLHEGSKTSHSACCAPHHAMSSGARLPGLLSRLCCYWQVVSCVRLFGTPWTVAH